MDGFVTICDKPSLLNAAEDQTVQIGFCSFLLALQETDCIAKKEKPKVKVAFKNHRHEESKRHRDSDSNVHSKQKKKLPRHKDPRHHSGKNNTDVTSFNKSFGISQSNKSFSIYQVIWE